MIAIDLVQDATTWLTGVTHWVDISQVDISHGLHWQLPFDLAQANKKLEVDLFGDVQRSFDNFVKTGQVWAFLIGIILGYIVRSFTSYG
jgi:hypothetical protein